jgi:hypothetical protein
MGQIAIMLMQESAPARCNHRNLAAIPIAECPLLMLWTALYQPASL